MLAMTTAAKVVEFANVFSEIFDNVIATRNGLVRLDEDIANNLLQKKLKSKLLLNITA